LSRYRVTQWATGNIGRRALREVIRHPDLDLVGVLVYDPAKDGVDAGELCGEPPTGVLATTDTAAVQALDADCVLYMPQFLDLDDVVALLEAGTNVVTTRGELIAGGQRLAPEERERVLDACKRGGTTVFSTGSSPGFITDSLPHALLSMQRHVECVEIFEYANLSRRDSPQMLFELMGFGRPLDRYSPRRAEYLLGEFGPALGELAVAAGWQVDDWRAEGSVAAARVDTTIVAGTIKAGTVGAQRNMLVGSSGGRDVVRFTCNWYCTEDLDPAWELGETGWRVRVDGDAPFDVRLPFPVPVEDLNDFTPAYTANRPVNAIPYVVAARPGIVSARELPPILPTGPGGHG
jgi:4-hydroxy-tetrahydrodipicolinate reductase